MEGHKVGEVRGREAGLIEGRKAVARSLLAEGMNEEQVARLAGLDTEDVAALRQLNQSV